MKLLTLVLLIFCQAAIALPLEKIVLPPGFKIEVFANDLPEAREMALSPSGILFVGSKAGKVYALKDSKKYVIAKGLNLPVGVAFHKGDLYISAVDRILKLRAIEASLENPPHPVVVYDRLPKDTFHGWKYLRIGPDEKLYLSIGAPCNSCLKDDARFATLARMNLDGTGFEIIAKGVRNSVGYAFQPKTGKLWFTDNGRDLMGDDVPPCELNRLDKIGTDFGFPYCHGGTFPDPEFNQKPCSTFQPPAQNLGAHVAPLGLAFYTGNMFPSEFRNQIFIAEHGSWNRSKKVGYRITLVKVDRDKVLSYHPFAYGWLDDSKQSNWGRPVDILVSLDGSLLVSDDFSGTIYKITHNRKK